MKTQLQCDECDFTTTDWDKALDHEAKFPGHWVQAK